MTEDRSHSGRPRYSASEKRARLVLFSGLYVVVMAILIAATAYVTSRSSGEQLVALWAPLALCYLVVIFVALRGTSRDTE